MRKMQEMQVWSLGREDPLEEGMASHSSVHAWKIPRIEELAGYCPQDRKESVMTEVTEHTHTHTHTSTYGWQAFGFWIMLYNSDKYSCHYFIRIHLFYSSPYSSCKDSIQDIRLEMQRSCYLFLLFASYAYCSNRCLLRLLCGIPF